MAELNFEEEIDKEELTEISGIKEVLNNRAGWEKTASLIHNRTTIAVTMPSPMRLEHYSMYVNPARRQLYKSLKRKFRGAKLIDARLELARQRMIKQPIEIKLIEKATDITADTLKEVLNSTRLSKYKNTEEIADDILKGFKERGGSGHAFDPVVAAGRNAATIHYGKYGKLTGSELIVCDVGAEFSSYCSDITRTVSYGRPTAKQQEVHGAVKSVQGEILELIKPGLDFKTYEIQVVHLVGLKLKELKLIDKLTSRQIRQYYPHSCSHSVGLDAHDSADYSQKMAENMVITVEPGIYIKEENIGVRIEDTVLITKDGVKVLSSHLPNSLSF
jgi:Xaa-Pro aminopeptidase